MGEACCVCFQHAIEYKNINMAPISISTSIDDTLATLQWELKAKRKSGMSLLGNSRRPTEDLEKLGHIQKLTL